MKLLAGIVSQCVATPLSIRFFEREGERLGTRNHDAVADFDMSEVIRIRHHYGLDAAVLSFDRELLFGSVHCFNRRDDRVLFVRMSTNGGPCHPVIQRSNWNRCSRPFLVDSRLPRNNEPLNDTPTLSDPRSLSLRTSSFEEWPFGSLTVMRRFAESIATTSREP